MKLNHLDLLVSDVQRTVALFERLFAMRLESSRTSPAIAILTDGDGFTLVLQRMKDAGETYPQDFHFGFLLDDPASVRAFHARATELVAEGREPVTLSEVIENGRGVLVYMQIPDGIMVEVSWQRPRRGAGGR
jgi:catechol 2,3-dioxygenase-like lactoylglutathione lyase family enzyme